MDMSSNNFIQQDHHAHSHDQQQHLHVAQQSRRQKLRGAGGEVTCAALPPGYFPAATCGNALHSLDMMGGPPYADVVHPSRFVVPATNTDHDAYTFHGGGGGGGDFKPFHSGSEHGLMLPNFVSDQVHHWGVNGGNELPLLPSFVNEPGSVPSHHGLSLSLSSNQPGGVGGGGGGGQEIKSFESGVVSTVVNPIQEMVGSSVHMYRNVGPLGPFTGYTAILKNSKFLKPAQQLLDEFLSMAGLRPLRGSEEAESVGGYPNRSSDFVSTRSRGGLIDFGNASSSCESYRPDCHEKKAKLIQMQEEVCKRHKQYHQQMEMVMSAFESVPGLGNATPFISRSLKIISRHFRCIKNVIADQLRHIRKVLGEDLTSQTNITKCESSSLRFEQNFPKVKSSSYGGMSYVGSQNHIWRPQRGLPERAVSVLRAWLFDHFLHPYPTDTDKQMLASQTGLSRNQVSNWFINARVRLWKPMVEEIHMLETKGGSRSEPNSNNNGMTSISTIRQASSNQGECKHGTNITCDKQFECLGSSSSMEECRGETSADQLFQKRSRIETHQIPTSMDGSLLGFLPYQRRGLEMGGLGAVSLTLGLRHGSENTQQQLQHQFQQQGLHYGNHVMHDFSG